MVSVCFTLLCRARRHEAARHLSRGVDCWADSLISWSCNWQVALRIKLYHPFPGVQLTESNGALCSPGLWRWQVLGGWHITAPGTHRLLHGSLPSAAGGFRSKPFSRGPSLLGNIFVFVLFGFASYFFLGGIPFLGVFRGTWAGHCVFNLL